MLIRIEDFRYIVIDHIQNLTKLIWDQFEGTSSNKKKIIKIGLHGKKKSTNTHTHTHTKKKKDSDELITSPFFRSRLLMRQYTKINILLVSGAGNL